MTGDILVTGDAPHATAAVSSVFKGSPAKILTALVDAGHGRPHHPLTQTICRFSLHSSLDFERLNPRELGEFRPKCSNPLGNHASIQSTKENKRRVTKEG
jgi:hypothetical protein